MPIPNPKSSEKKQDFISRCIETLTKDKKDEFPSARQRAAVCYSQWDEHEKNKKTEGG